MKVITMKSDENIINGKASVCEWSLEFSFINKQQCIDFINDLLQEEVDYSFSYSPEFDGEDSHIWSLWSEKRWSKTPRIEIIPLNDSIS